MVKHPQRIRQLLPTNCLSVFNHFVGLALKGLTNFRVFLTFVPTLLNFIRFGSPPGSSSWPHLFLEPYFILPCLLFKCMRWNGYFSLYSLFKNFAWSTHLPRPCTTYWLLWKPRILHCQNCMKCECHLFKTTSFLLVEEEYSKALLLLITAHLRSTIYLIRWLGT